MINITSEFQVCLYQSAAIVSFIGAFVRFMVLLNPNNRIIVFHSAIIHTLQGLMFVGFALTASQGIIAPNLYRPFLDGCILGLMVYSILPICIYGYRVYNRMRLR